MTLKIERVPVTRRVKIGELFTRMGFTVDAAPTDESGDSIVRPPYDFNIATLDPHADDIDIVYKPVRALRWTHMEEMVELRLRGNARTTHIVCSPDHIVYACRPALGHVGWCRVRDLEVDGTTVLTMYGWLRVEHVYVCDGERRLCDVQVDDLSSFLTNDILSHNSHMLVHFGAEALIRRLNVIHYTFELSETAIGLRYDSHLTGIESNQIPAFKDDVIRIEDKMSLGKLIIKGYPTGTASTQTLRAHIERCILQNVKPDIIMIDYADIMRSTRRYDSPRFELKLIYEELRNLAMHFNVPIWTASQANRDSATSEIVGLEAMSEAYGKAMVADVVVSLSRKPEEKATKLGRLFVAKNRAGNDGIVYPVKIDTATSTIAVIEGSESLSLLEAQQNDEDSLRRMLREKWHSIRRDDHIHDKTVTSDTVAMK